MVFGRKCFTLIFVAAISPFCSSFRVNFCSSRLASQQLGEDALADCAADRFLILCVRSVQLTQNSNWTFFRRVDECVWQRDTGREGEEGPAAECRVQNGTAAVAAGSQGVSSWASFFCSFSFVEMHKNVLPSGSMQQIRRWERLPPPPVPLRGFFPARPLGADGQALRGRHPLAVPLGHGEGSRHGRGRAGAG